MAQGTLKSKKLSTATARASGGKHSVLGPKKGARTIAPRKQVLVRNAGMTKVCYINTRSSTPGKAEKANRRAVVNGV